MATLGLLPPYTEADLKEAYREKAKSAHPDRGGTAGAFHELHTAYEHAMHYIQLRKDRRAWIASQMEAYVELLDVTAALARRYSAEIGWDRPEWLEQSFGDFAHLIDRVVSIRLENSPAASQMIDDLVVHQAALKHLHKLELCGSRVGDDSVLKLSAFPSLSRLDLRKTPVTSRVAAIVGQLPNLQALELAGTSVGWWTRRRLRTALGRRNRISKAKRVFWFWDSHSRPRPHLPG
jgi:hypothetical protein